MVDTAATSLWAHYNPVRVIAGIGAFGLLHELVAPGDVLLVTTAGSTRRGLTDRVKTLLGGSRVLVHDAITPNPELDYLDDVAKTLKNENISTIVGLGGGSVLDAAKVLSVILPSDIPHLLSQVLREGYAHDWLTSFPVIAIPTAAGTGAEFTPFATVWDSRDCKKHSVTGEHVYPDHAVLDPELTLTLPYEETLYSGLDAISHALESLWNKNRTPISEAWARQALNLAVKSLPAVLDKPDDLEYRKQMQYASSMAGLAISQTRTAIAHSISYPLTIHCGMPHGLACSFTLPSIITFLKNNNILQEFRELFLSVEKLLLSLDLSSEVAKYTDFEKSSILLNGMYLPNRADNFVVAIEQKDILSFIEGSLP